MPANAQKQWKVLLDKNLKFRVDSEEAAALALRDRSLGVITCGLGLRYYLENEDDWAAERGGARPSHLHIGRYPVSGDKIRQLAGHVERLLVIEEGYPYIEREIAGIFSAPIPVAGKLSGEIPLDGELSADSVRKALGFAPKEALPLPGIRIPLRPPQFCQGCPHADSISALKEALSNDAEFFAASDIGCYTLSALPPYKAVDSCVDMGASIGMARGASCVGQKSAVAIIGDSTFYHSGMTNLVDAVAHKTWLTILILDNSTTGMTGAQPTISPGSRLPALLEGLGVERAHIRELEAHKKNHAINVAVIREELDYQGVSVIVLKRECLEYLKKSETSMNYNIILAGVGGQGGLSVSVLIARAAMAAGYSVKQSEVHGMSQRGGEVLAHLRISDREIQSPTIPKGEADLILAFESLEALRYIAWLSADRGAVVAASTPLKNISDYPDINDVMLELKKLPRYRIIDADALAKAGRQRKSSQRRPGGSRGRSSADSIRCDRKGNSDGFRPQRRSHRAGQHKGVQRWQSAIQPLSIR